MPIVKVEWLLGRTPEQRNAVAKGITEVFVREAGLQPDQLIIVFDEIDPELEYKGGVTYAQIRRRSSG